MHIRHIRSATLILAYAGKRFLVDPWLAEEGSMPPVRTERRNPLVGLPIPLEAITDVDAVVVTHLHFDHFDDAAARALPKTLPLFAQNEDNAGALRSMGFTDVRVLREEGVSFEGISLFKTPCEHGQGERIQRFYKEKNLDAEACGVVFAHPDEPTAYLAGDTVWCESVRESLAAYRPGVVIVNAGHAFVEDIPIIMGAQDVFEVGRTAPGAKIVAVHMEAVDHARLTRQALRDFAEEKGMASRVFIPKDGESLALA